jgi:hypothetical protein
VRNLLVVRKLLLYGYQSSRYPVTRTLWIQQRGKRFYHNVGGEQVKTTELLHIGLEIDERWQIVDASYDAARRQFDVSITEPSGKGGWFSRGKTSSAATEKHVWRHVNIGSRRCFVHLAVSPGQLPTDCPWSGEKGMPFTHALSRQIAALLMHGVNLQAICSVLDISLTDLWKLKYNLDSGKTRLAAAPPPSASAEPTARPAGAPNDGVPDTTDPVWERLLDGSVNIDIRFLSLKLLLTKLREQMRVIDDNEVRMLKIYEIQRYFERNEPRLKHELTQLASVGN